MTIQQLKYVIKIVQCGSITEAARQLFISQPSLSAALKDLEGEFGIEIFHRTSRGITLSADGIEFLSYARQIIEQTELLEQRYMDKKPSKQLSTISTQHYPFAIHAFAELIASLDVAAYELTLRETRTYEIIEDVANFRSELGILYLSKFNEEVIGRLLKEKHLTFVPLFDAAPHIFIAATHPLAASEVVRLDELDLYPCLSFEQGIYNSFYFSEELFSTVPRQKIIRVSDRATLSNLLLGLNGYTIGTGVTNENLNDERIVSVPLATDASMRIGFVLNEKVPLSDFACRYIEKMRETIVQAGFTLIESKKDVT